MESEERPFKIRKLRSRDVDEADDNGNETDLEDEGEPFTLQADHIDGLTNDLQSSDWQVIREFDGEVFQDGSAPHTSQSPLGTSLSKTQIKKLRRQQEWEAGREERKAIKKQKRQESKRRKREARDQTATAAPEDQIPFSDEVVTVTQGQSLPARRPRPLPVLLPITIILDCGFDDLMTDKERISLASQLARCYSDNHKSPFQAHLAVSSFNGHLKERFDNVLHGHYRAWKGVRFFEKGFAEVSKEAQEWMSSPSGGRLGGILTSEPSVDDGPVIPGETVYLTSESPNELSRLKPYSTYIIGGLVDRNRHKGICYKRALDHGIQTARLPIGTYMTMMSRFVLTTNHVNEIMLKWLSNGDWRQSLSEVMPKRKQGVLKGRDGGEGDDDCGGKEDIPEDPHGIKVNSRNDSEKILCVGIEES